MDSVVVTLERCPVGLFWSGETLCLKTEYGNNNSRIDAYIVESGEFFWGAAPQTIASQRAQMVTPIDTDAVRHRLASAAADAGGWSTCVSCGAKWPSAPSDHVHKCQCGGRMVRDPLTAAPAPAADVERLRAEFARLHEAARGCEFDLSPADGPIAKLTLFTHEHGDAILAALAPRDPAPEQFADDAGGDGVREARLLMFLEILAAAGGQSDAGDWTGNWINAFCEGHEGRDPDTFNLAIERGLTRSSHDTSFDTSTVWITDAGRAALQPAAPAERGERL